MNILILGDAHTYGYGLSAGQLSYIGHFIRQISQSGPAVSVEAYAHLTIPQAISTLSRLPLNQYDLIIIQPNQHWLITRSNTSIRWSSSKPEPLSPSLLWPLRTDLVAIPGPATRNRLRSLIQMTSWRLRNWLGLTKPPKALLELLRLLSPYRHNVLLVTPFAHLNPWCHAQREHCRVVLQQEGEKQLFSVFDSHLIVAPREEYFLADSQTFLNNISHELVGRALFDFYQSAPTIVTVQAIKRE
jgi:hypothetical protein